MTRGRQGSRTIAATKDSTATWDNLPFGTYRVVEETKAGWYSPVVTSGTYTINATTRLDQPAPSPSPTRRSASISAKKKNGFDQLHA